MGGCGWNSGMRHVHVKSRTGAGPLSSREPSPSPWGPGPAPSTREARAPLTRLPHQPSNVTCHPSCSKHDPVTSLPSGGRQEQRFSAGEICGPPGRADAGQSGPSHASPKHTPASEGKLCRERQPLREPPGPQRAEGDNTHCLSTPGVWADASARLFPCLSPFTLLAPVGPGSTLQWTTDATGDPGAWLAWEASSLRSQNHPRLGGCCSGGGATAVATPPPKERLCGWERLPSRPPRGGCWLGTRPGHGLDEGCSG